MPANQPMDYTVEFQNEPAATAPAQQVVVTEQIDASLDWNSFQLGDFGFGNILVTVPPGHTSYQTVVDATGSVGVLVDVSANFNPKTGVATWTFTSEDPTTLDAPSNPWPASCRWTRRHPKATGSFPTPSSRSRTSSPEPS